MSKSVVIKLLGQRNVFSVQCDKLYALWKLKRSFQLMDLEMITMLLSSKHKRLTRLSSLRFFRTMYKNNIIQATGGMIGQLLRSIRIQIMVTKDALRARPLRSAYKGSSRRGCPMCSLSVARTCDLPIREDTNAQSVVDPRVTQQPTLTSFNIRAGAEASTQEISGDRAIFAVESNLGARFNLITDLND
ncbi:hypothetical protein CXB51_007980 [Gossypium anomalum]|uniref:Uncharacterized protein n=1 Tax=Gossypium anomalum TaxID=47600 RepID=A0A8J6D7Q1_9ROSI|nr:hypothetical protein CXB51_007980 [Gossypium anomalum]